MSILNKINWVFDLQTGGHKRPVFFDIDKTRPELRALERAFPDIRKEVVALLPHKAAMPRYHDLDRMQIPISGVVNPDKNWKIFYLYAMGEKPEDNRARCPDTTRQLDAIPELFQAFFSILEGGKSVPAHCGPYRGYIRYHLGLVVPRERPPSIRIKDTHYTWTEGEGILFDDSWDHEVYNSSPGDRVVLIVDIRRPMGLLLNTVNRALVSIIRVLYGKRIMKRLA